MRRGRSALLDERVPRARSKRMKKLLRELEEAVVDAWPATETAELDGWLLRASRGPTHRGNSVATLDAGPELELVPRIEQAEAWYRERAQPAMFQVGPCAAPRELDDALAERGYRKEGEAVCALAPAAQVAALTSAKFPSLAWQTSVDAKASAAWLAVAAHASRFAAEPDVFRGFLARLGSRCRYVSCRDAQGKVIAGCLGITSEERFGVYAMFTSPAWRRKGAGRALLHALASHAGSEHLRELYLLVELENSAARALYAQSGFHDLYAYHYRVQPRRAPHGASSSRPR